MVKSEYVGELGTIIGQDISLTRDVLIPEVGVRDPSVVEVVARAGHDNMTYNGRSIGELGHSQNETHPPVCPLPGFVLARTRVGTRSATSLEKDMQRMGATSRNFR